MSTPKPIKKNNNQPRRSGSKDTQSSQSGTAIQPNPIPDTEDKPYGLVPLPTKIHREHPAKQNRDAGHDRFKENLISGKVQLTLTVKTSTFVASGLIAMGRDVGFKGDLIKTAIHQGKTLIIPGSSLKGAVRATYESLTQSCLCKTKAKREKIPYGHGECKIKKGQTEVCPACRVFGAMGWQGLISFPDAVGQSASTDIEFMPNLYGPKPKNPMYDNQGKVAGRKFYYHAVEAVNAKRDADGNDKSGVDAQKVKPGYVFKTALQFKNLTEAELGTLLIILGQDSAYPMALKVGGGKPIGMGSMVAIVEAIEKTDNLKERYDRYTLSESNRLTGNALKSFVDAAIATAHRTLIEEYQLKELARILAWPTQYHAPNGMY